MVHGSGTESRSKRLYRAFLAGESAQDLVEYALVAVIISAGCIVTFSYILSSSISTALYLVAQKLQKIFYGVAW